MKARVFSSRTLTLILVLAMTLSMFTIGVSATTVGKVSIASGEPIAIDWAQNGTTYIGTIVNAATLSDTVYSMPSSFVLWTEGEPTFTLGSGITATYLYEIEDDDETDPVNMAYEIDVSGIAEGETSTMSVVVDGDTYNVELSSATPISAGGTEPTSVLSYAPLGQFARGTGWGSVTGKFTNGYESTGVSLGAFGGYIDFYFQGGITNDPKNPYGVDFVVYGNAFNGNPEAGAVQVSEDGITWYELAGSRYYDGNFAATNATQATGKFANAYTGTLNNATIEYDGSSGTSINAAVKVGSTTKLVANPFVSSYTWWPTAAKGYPAIAAHVNSNGTKTSNVQVTCSDTVFSSTGLTLIPDSNTTADYAFGYADVTPNGSPAAYGNAVNPYTAYTSSKTGGDGFDLEWAVDITTGEPVDVTDMTFYYVRVYSAVLDNGTFGETSTEICGIFTAIKADADVNYTDDPTSLTINGTEIANLVNAGSVTENEDDYGVVFYDASQMNLSVATISASATSTANVYINSSSTGTYTKTSTVDYVRVIVQDGVAAPYIAVIKF